MLRYIPHVAFSAMMIKHHYSCDEVNKLRDDDNLVLSTEFSFHMYVYKYMERKPQSIGTKKNSKHKKALSVYHTHIFNP